MESLYLNVPFVVELHDDAIAEFGGLNGVRSPELLDSAVMQPQQSAFGEDAYESMGAKAAAYAYFIASNHPFLDGNKRTAAAAMMAFLKLNGYRLDRTEQEVVDVMVAMASKETSKEDFFAWVEESIEGE